MSRPAIPLLEVMAVGGTLSMPSEIRATSIQMGLRGRLSQEGVRGSTVFPWLDVDMHDTRLGREGHDPRIGCVLHGSGEGMRTPCFKAVSIADATWTHAASGVALMCIACGLRATLSVARESLVCPTVSKSCAE